MTPFHTPPVKASIIDQGCGDPSSEREKVLKTNVTFDVGGTNTTSCQTGSDAVKGGQRLEGQNNVLLLEA